MMNVKNIDKTMHTGLTCIILSYIAFVLIIQANYTYDSWKLLKYVYLCIFFIINIYGSYLIIQKSKSVNKNKILFTVTLSMLAYSTLINTIHYPTIFIPLILVTIPLIVLKQGLKYIM